MYYKVMTWHSDDNDAYESGQRFEKIADARRVLQYTILDWRHGHGREMDERPDEVYARWSGRNRIEFVNHGNYAMSAWIETCLNRWPGTD